MKKKLALTIFLVLGTLAKGTAQVPQIPSFSVLSQSVRRGDVLVVILSPYSRVPRVAVRIFGHNYEPNNYGIVYIGVNPETKPGRYIAYLVDVGTGIRIDWFNMRIGVLERQFPEVTIPRNKGSIDVSRWQKDKTKINKAYQKADKHKDYAKGQFVKPLNVIAVADEFYLRRKFLDGVSIHHGTDLKAAVGTPVYAIGSGKIILTGYNFLLEGNVVILDHGSGVLSYYLHLSKINVREGRIVAKGEIIALSGDTGLGVRYPHLHFAVKIHGTSIDPLEFIKTMNSR